MLYAILHKVEEPINDVKLGFTVFSQYRSTDKLLKIIRVDVTSLKYDNSHVNKITLFKVAILRKKKN